VGREPLLTGDDWRARLVGRRCQEAVDEFVAGSNCKPARLRRQFVLRKV
jgi:hypothetical protein